MSRSRAILLAAALVALLPAVLAAQAKTASAFYEFTLNDIDGKPVSMSDYRGQVVMVVNTASYCGFTGQFAGLESMYERYRAQGFVILGFPSNDFLGQDPGSDADIKDFCTSKYDVSFPMFAKTKVTGTGKNPLYAWLTDKKIHPKTGGEISWNFNKFLIGRDGAVVARYASTVDPADAKLRTALEQALAAAAP